MAALEKRFPFLTLKVSDSGGFASRIHSHPSVSLGYIEFGNTEFNVNNQRYNLLPGDMVLIPSETPHLCLPENESDFRYRLLFFTAEWWRENTELPPSDFRTHAAPAAETLKGLITGLKNGEETLTENDILRVMKEITGKLRMNTEKKPDLKDELNSVTEIHKLIRDLPEISTTMDEYAREFGINKYSLIRKYAGTYGLTPHADKINMRIQRSILMFESDYSLTDIGLECGFSDQSHFIRQFKLYTGLRPQEYRNAILSDPPIISDV